MPTIRDVARVAKVAPSTVSGVLNRPHRVRRETRQRVEAAIATLGYTHQPVGRPARDNKQHVAVVTGGHRHCLPMVSALNDHRSDASSVDCDHFLVRAMHQAVIQHGHHIHSYAGYASVRENLVFREAVANDEIDGVILVRESPADGYLDWLLEQGVATVAINREPTPERPFAAVGADNFRGGRQAAEHFVAGGHERLAVVQADDHFSYNRLRTAGFVSGARAAGVQPRVVVLENWEQLPDQCSRLMADGVTAVFGTTDTLALGCLKWVQEQGGAVPADLSVIGFDNLGQPSEAGTRLSSIGYDVGEIAHLAMRMLDMLGQYKGKIGRLSATVNTQLFEFDTTAARHPRRDGRP